MARKDWGDLLAQDVDMRIHKFFATTAAMLALPPDEFEDGQLIDCGDQPSPFIWRQFSWAKTSPNSIVAPTYNSFNPATTAGRFFRQDSVQAMEYHSPGASSATVLQAATATVLTPSTATLLSGGLTELGKAPRQLLFTIGGATPAHRPLTATVSGRDAMGNVQSETVNLPSTATTVLTTKFYVDTGLTVSFIAATGTDATVAIGTGTKLGFFRPVQVRQSAPMVIQEWTDGAISGTAGTYNTTDLPFGSWTPNTTPNGSHNFVVLAEVSS